MSYQDQLKRKLNRTNIRNLVLYGFLALICCTGALGGLRGHTRVDILSLFSIPSQITGTIFLFLFVVMLIVLVRTLSATFSHEAYNNLCESISKYGSPDTILTYIGRLSPNPLCSHGELRFDKKYISFVLDDLCIVRPMHEVDWGYLTAEVEAAKAANKRGHSLQLPSTPSPEVNLLMEDNYVLTIRARNAGSAEKLLDEIKKDNPEMAIGFNEKNASIYKKNPRNMRSKANIPEGVKEDEE